MTLIFQGHGEAKKAAIDLSVKKDKYKTWYVVKYVEGGITYRVMDNLEGIRKQNNVLNKYQNGLVVK